MNQVVESSFWQSIRKHPVASMSIGYALLIWFGIAYDYGYYYLFRINILNYVGPGDFLWSAFRSPQALLLCLFGSFAFVVVVAIDPLKSNLFRWALLLVVPVLAAIFLTEAPYVRAGATFFALLAGVWLLSKDLLESRQVRDLLAVPILLLWVSLVPTFAGALGAKEEICEAEPVNVRVLAPDAPRGVAVLRDVRILGSTGRYTFFVKPSSEKPWSNDTFDPSGCLLRALTGDTVAIRESGIHAIEWNDSGPGVFLTDPGDTVTIPTEEQTRPGLTKKSKRHETNEDPDR